MTISSFDALFYTAIFLLPGFVINEIIEKTNPPKKQTDGSRFLLYLFYSILNMAIWSWLYLIIVNCESLNLIKRLLLSLLVSLICSALFGIFIAIFKQQQIVDRFLSLIRIRTINSTPSAWDYIFSKQEEAFVIITLVDDSILCGLYSYSSFTSSDADERDIFVERAYKYEDGEWIDDPQSLGFYVPKDQIRAIEFKKGIN